VNPIEITEQEFELWDDKEKKVVKVKAKKAGSEWMALCPFHDDHNPSLSINTEKGVWYCHGCGKGGTLYKKRRIVETYDHRDEDGKFLYQIVRYDPKGFAYRTKAPDGNWKYGAQGIKKVLYRLPELIKADKNKPIIFVEGGKDVDNVKALGLESTTYFLVKGEWPDEYKRYFEGRIVVLCPDNDETGRNYSFNIGESLIEVTKKLIWLELPDLDNKEDISDWIEKGGTAEKLQKLIDDAPDFSEVLAEYNKPVEPEIKEVAPVFEKDKYKIEIPENDLIKQYMDYVCPTTDAPDIFHEVSAISIISTLLARKVFFNFGTQSIYPNIWAVLVAPSTTYRKSTSINIAKTIIRNWFEKFLLPEEFSQEALMEYFSINGAKGILVWSEFGAFLASSQKQYMSGIKEFLADIYDCPDFKKRLLKKESYLIVDPYINILTATTLDWFLRSIEESDIMGGFLPRFIYVVATKKDKKKIMAFPGPPDYEKLNKFIKYLTLLCFEGEIKFDNESMEIYEKWITLHEEMIDKQSINQTISGFYGRLGTTCLKLAVIFQISEDRKKVVKANAMKRAVNFAEKLKENIYILLSDKIGFSREEREKKKVLELIQEKGIIDRSVLLRYSGMKSKTLDEYLSTLMEEGRIEKIVTDIKYRNRKKTEYRFIN